MRTKRIKLYKFMELPIRVRINLLNKYSKNKYQTLEQVNTLLKEKEFLQDGTLYNETK